MTLFGSGAYGKDPERDFLGGFIGYQAVLKDKFLISPRLDGVQFMGEPPEEDHHHDHGGGDEEPAEEHGHAHGLILTETAGSLSVTVSYLLYGNLRFGLDYRYGLLGVEDKATLQVQFAL